MLKKAFGINTELLQLYKETYQYYDNNKELIEMIVNKYYLYDISTNIVDTHIKIAKNKRMFIYLNDDIFKQIKLQAIKYNVKYSDYINCILYCLLDQKININIEDYTMDKEIIFYFPEEIIKYKLNDEIKNDIDKLINDKNIYSKLYNGNINEAYYNIYKMRYIFGYCSNEISHAFNKGTKDRTMLNWLKKMDWQFDTFEAQQKVVQRGFRDYKQIMNASKNTKAKNALIGSLPEEYTRQKLNLLMPLNFIDYDVIIGLNNISILDNGREIDIPIIIINNENKIYKFGVEYNENYWHNDVERDDDKQNLSKQKKYKVFGIYPSVKENSSELILHKFIDLEIMKIIHNIKNIITSKGELN